MAQITAALVKELREKTGAGMMDCKKALNDTDGDLDAAVDWLRKKGLSAAEKKSSRVAADGLVSVAAGGTSGAVAEVNSETDFVARNDRFQGFVRTIAELALANEGDMDAVMEAGYPETDRTVAEQLTNNIATIGENQSVRRMTCLSVNDGVVASYIHNAAAENVGKIGVLVALESAGDKAQLEALGKQIAMHVAAASPLGLTEDDIDAETVAREEAIFKDQALASGKPAEIVEKMMVGRMRKYFEQVVLLKQTFVIDGERSIEKVVADLAKELGTDVKLTGFVRFQLGEGIEKEETDFAAEVAQAVAG